MKPIPSCWTSPTSSSPISYQDSPLLPSSLAASGHYKILILESVCIDKNKSRAKVLTFGTSTWRDVGHAPYPLNGQFPSAALNGALHWLVDDDDASSAVLYPFDIDKEVTYQIPSPPNLGKCTKRMSLEVIQNFLCIFHDTHLVHFDTWSMKDYGVETSWTLDRILRSSVPDTLRYEELDPITLWKDCEILMRCGSADLISYNQKERIIAVCEMHNAFMMLKVKSHAAHALNLSSLKKITMGECLKIKKFTGYTNLMRHGSLISYNHNKGSFTRFEIHNKNLWYGVKAHPTYALNFSSLKTIAMGESLMIKKLTNYSNVMKCSGDDAFFPDVEGPVRY